MFRISFSIAKAWKDGRFKDAVAMYLHLPTYCSSAMHHGRKQHEFMKEYVEKHSKLPEFWDSTPLIKPVCEKKFEVMINSWLQLVWIMDCWNVSNILEYKFVKEPDQIAKYVSSGQCELYALGMSKMGVEINQAEYLLVDMVSKNAARSKVWISRNTIKEAEDELVEIAADFKSYLISNNLLKE